MTWYHELPDLVCPICKTISVKIYGAQQQVCWDCRKTHKKLPTELVVKAGEVEEQQGSHQLSGD